MVAVLLQRKLMQKDKFMSRKKKLYACSAMLAMALQGGAANAAPINDVPEKSAPEAGIITGHVSDAEHNMLPGASISVKGVKNSVTTDESGYFKISGLKPGRSYELTVSYVGYTPVTKTIEIDTKTSESTEFVLADVTSLAEVAVVSPFHGQRKALQMQKQSMGVMNVVSADQVGKFPDSNIGDALKRISGINVQYDQGEARFGQIRGTSADLTSVCVNGNRLPSAEGDTRNVQLDLIPADMVQTIEVSKVVTADMDGDAIGGHINLVTKETPSRRVLNFTAGLGGTFVSGKPQFNLGGTWGQRFFDEHLGIMAAASYQRAPGGSDNVEFEYTLDDDGKVVLKEGQVRQYYVTRERQSYSLSLDYKFNALHKISFKGIYNRRNDWENRYRISYKKLSEAPSKQNVVIQTKAGSADNHGARLELQQTMDFTLDGEHQFGRLAADWAVSFSHASEDRPNERYAALKLKGTDWAASFEDAGERHPYSSLPIPDFDDKGWKVDELTNSNQAIDEDEWKARLNFELPLAKGDFANTLKFGAKLTNKTKDRTTSFFSYDEDVISDWRDNLVSQVRPGFYAGSNYPIGQQFISKDYLSRIDFSKHEGEEVLEEEAGNYHATERITSGFLRFDQQLGRRMDATIGLRVENTHLSTHGLQYVSEEVDDEVTEELKPTGTFTNSYTDLLPSLLLKYKMSDDGHLRFSVTRTLSRPKYSAMIANKIFKLSDQEATIGNPDIKPTTAWNMDLSAEYYFKSIGLVSAGVFFKDIKNVNVETVGYYKGSEIGLAGNDDLFTVEQNLNAYDARVLGVEAAFQRDFGFIAPALKCIGVYANYTYTHSWTHNYNPHLGILDTDNVKMAGSPEHTANASLFFEKKGWQARLSYNYASSFVDEMNTGSRELDRYYDCVHYLDLNASYTFGKRARVTIFGEATNLLNQPLRYYQGTPDRTMQAEYYGVRLNAGVKVSL